MQIDVFQSLQSYFIQFICRLFIQNTYIAPSYLYHLSSLIDGIICLFPRGSNPGQGRCNVSKVTYANVCYPPPGGPKCSNNLQATKLFIATSATKAGVVIVT